MFTQNLAFYNILLGVPMVAFRIFLLLYHAMDYQCLLYLFAGNEVISVFKYKQSRKPILETTSGNSSLKFFPSRTTLVTQISISQNSSEKQCVCVHIYTPCVCMCIYIHTHTQKDTHNHI